MEAQRQWVAKIILSKANKTRGIVIPDFKLYCRVMARKKQHATGTKTDNKTNGTEQETKK